MKCCLLEDGSKCKQCADHLVECRPRTRKRKPQSLDDGQREYDDSTSSIRGATKYQQDASDASGATAKRRSSSFIRTSRLTQQRSSSVNVPELFVNRDNGTGLSPESSEHTVSPAQDRFRSASFLSRSAILGEDFQDIDHAHTETAPSDEKISSIEMKALRLHGAFDFPDLALRQSLIEAYIERCYTWMPVVDLGALATTSQQGEHSILLLQAVVLVGALMRPDVCSKAFCDRQYLRVKALIHSGFERNPLNVLAALCLVQWYTPTAPKDISTDVPRFWNTYAVGLAQQMGLHRPATKQVPNPGLRSRIWWTMVVRDNLTASAHGRPRIIQPEDCTCALPTIQDFVTLEDSRAEIFKHYVDITRILGDLCQLTTRHGEASPEDKESIAIRLQAFLESLPESLRLYSLSGLAQGYNLELAQLHVPILIAITILFRPRTVYQLTADNAASVTAAFLSFRVFQAIQLREQTRFLGSPFAWHLMVTAIPLLSSTKVAALQHDANEALDAVEAVLETLGKVRPAASNNLRNVMAIRKAMSSTSRNIGNTDASIRYSSNQGLGVRRFGPQLLQAYGLEAVHQFEQIADVLRSHAHSQADRSAQAAAQTLSSLSGRPDASLPNGHLTPEPDVFAPSALAQADIQNAFTAVFEDEVLSSSWMVQDWMNELQF